MYISTIEDRYMDVMGVDIDADMLDVTKEKTEDAILHYAHVTSWTPTDEDLTFDAVIIVGSLFHLTCDGDVRALARNVYHSLLDGGTFSSGFVPGERWSNSPEGNDNAVADPNPDYNP